MTRRTEHAIIRIELEPQEDGTTLVTSPDVDLFALVIQDESEIDEGVLPVLKDTIERRLHVEILDMQIGRRIDFESDATSLFTAAPPAHVIAQMAM